MILGSHNSMSYLDPVDKWMKPFKFMAKCQSRDFFDQLNQGCELFDLRFAWIGEKKLEDPHFAHGLVTFDNSKHHPKYVLDWLNMLSARLYREESRRIHVRVICERPEDNEIFTEYCAYIEKHYKELAFFGGRDKKTWKILYNFTCLDVKMVDKYSSCNCDTKYMTGWHLDDLYPRIYAMLLNRHWREKFKDFDGFLLQDFVGVY